MDVYMQVAGDLFKVCLLYGFLAFLFVLLMWVIISYIYKGK